MLGRSIRFAIFCSVTVCVAPFACQTSQQPPSPSDAGSTAKGGFASGGNASTGGRPGSGGAIGTGGNASGGASASGGAGGLPGTQPANDAAVDQGGLDAARDAGPTDATSTDGAKAEVGGDILTTDAVSDVGRADAGDTKPDAQVDGSVDANQDVPGTFGDAPSDSASKCGDCPAGLTCGGGGDPLRCGITVTTKPGKVCSPDGWCWISPKPQGNELRAVFATSKNDIWAVGLAGTIIHYDGTEWSGTTGLFQAFAPDSNGVPITKNQATFGDVWASGPGDVWIAPYLLKDAALGNYRPLLLQGDGSHWNEVVIPGTSSTTVVGGLWGTGPGDVWVLDAGGKKISRNSNGAWTSIDVPAAVGIPTRFWGISATEVYVAGTKALYRYDGSNWQQEISSEIDGVWASTAAGAWAYFSNYVYHRLGSTWVKLTAPTDCGYGFWGTSESSMWFGSCYFDGSNWTDLLGTSAVRAVTGTAEGGAVGVGTEGRVVSLSKTTATPYPSPTTGGYADIAATGSNNVWMVGNKLDTTNGLASEAVHWDGTSFSVYNQSPPQYFTSVALSPAGALWASGPDPTGTLTTTWQLSNGTFVSPTGAPAGITRMWAAADDAIWAIDGKSAAINVYNGTSWQTASHLLSSSSVKFWALRGSARDDVWVGGTTGMTEHWNGSQWTAYPTPVTDTIVSLWSLDKSHAWAASTAGDVLAWDGTQWTKLTNLNTDVADIHGCSANDNWVINNTKGNPILHHYDGSTWQDSNPGVLYFSNPRIWCASAGDVWLVGPGVLRRQGP